MSENLPMEAEQQGEPRKTPLSASGGSPCSTIFVRMGKSVLKDKYHPEARLWDEHGQHSKKRREHEKSDRN